MGRIGARQQRFEVLPEPDWSVADVLARVDALAREVNTVSRSGTSTSAADAPEHG